jgi:hypothetical protein
MCDDALYAFEICEKVALRVAFLAKARVVVSSSPLLKNINIRILSYKQVLRVDFSDREHPRYDGQEALFRAIERGSIPLQFH